ncbi:hypothetical protein K470DRAFT_276781 [Piedraia hortae CBS 480.64]|uniref:HORMA domain-containing protein n=1 Tax=Piedraia hortae CBS 480.64 TaxID=1314780 RepID=A0A6A7BZK4_9PEZI|nr:hypothetical protein K470DRAFT_276781 [Piedraia hortae CBS 480.64]
MDEQQSLDIVRTMLHGCLSSVAYLRSFFPESFFDQQVYMMSDRIYPYRDYASGKLPRKSGSTQVPCTVMKVLRRGRSRRVDKLLDWLEKVAFVAIKEGRLQSLQIGVHPDQSDNQTVIESYEFSINYINDANRGRSPSGIRMSGSDIPIISAEASNSALQTMLRQTMHICEVLPELPADRYISMGLVYNEPTDESTVPEGFKPVTGEDAFTFDGEIKRTEMLKDVDSAFHRSNLTVLTSLDVDTSTPQPVESEVNETELEPEPELEPDMPGTPTTAVDVEMTTPEKAYEDFGVSGLQIEDSMPQAQTITKTDTMPSLQAGETPAQLRDIRDTFKNMMQTEQVTQGDTQTQTAAWGSLMSQAPANRLPAAEPSTKPVITPAKAAELKLDESKLTGQAGQSSFQGEVVHCQCGLIDQDMDMVECASCGMWQHLPCYGYMRDSDPRLPVAHVCYQCLLGEDEQSTLEMMKNLTLSRRMMYIAFTRGFPAIRVLVEKLQISNRVATAIYQHAKTNQFILRISGQRKWMAVREGPAYEQLKREFFDPMLHIAHHYILPENWATLQAAVQPPSDENECRSPAPHTPSRDGSTLVNTPSLTSTRSKRVLEDSPVTRSSTAGKPPPRKVRCLRSGLALNARGLESSPRG